MQMYPAQIRSTAHGISAATGKIGSIMVVVWLNYLGNRNKFWITWPVALLGACICWTFVADLTGLDLAEQVSQSSWSHHTPLCLQQQQMCFTSCLGSVSVSGNCMLGLVLTIFSACVCSVVAVHCIQAVLSLPTLSFYC